MISMRHYKGTRRCADKCAAGPKACDTCARKMYDVARIIFYYIGMYILPMYLCRLPIYIYAKYAW